MSKIKVLPSLIDSHCHLRTTINGSSVLPDSDICSCESNLSGSSTISALNAVQVLTTEMLEANVFHSVVLHLAWQPWSMEEFASAINSHDNVTGFVNIDPNSPTAISDLKRAYDLGFRGLKLHPRIQKYYPDEISCINLVRAAGELGFPVVIDCFPDGDWLLAGMNLLQYANLCKKSPDTTIIVAHAAGHHCLDLLMLAKRIDNLWFDLSYSLLYYSNPVTDAIFYAMKSIRYDRVLFGTDYPDRSLKTSIQMSLALFDSYNVNYESRDKVLWKNATSLLNL